MARLHLVRHAKPSAIWGEDPDPGLDPLGESQAETTAAQLAALTQRPIYSSPLRRCRETAAPLARLWQSEPAILRAVAEIPSPPGLDATTRRAWLTTAMGSTWTDLHENAPPGSGDYLQWRHDLIRALVSLEHDCVIYSHYIAINVAVGAATNRQDVICFRPDHASVTILETRGDALALVELGREAATSVLTR
jgi:broad specificity phosphatase PhoE